MNCKEKNTENEYRITAKTYKKWAEELRKKISAKCYDRVQEFAWNRKAEKIVEIYQQLLKNSNKS